MAMKKSAKKAPRKSAKKAPRKSSQRAFSPLVQQKVAESMHELKAGTLRSGRSKKKVTSRRQAIAIGLSEARREGASVPPPRRPTQHDRHYSIQDD